MARSEAPVGSTMRSFSLIVFIFCFTQDVEATPDKDDSRALQIIVHRPFASRNRSVVNPIPLLSARFIFDDYIRCMSARQRLQRRGATLRHRKMTTLANLLELPDMAAPPTHFYSLTPYNTGAQGYVWSPSSRGYTNRSDGTSAEQSSPKPSTASRQAAQKSLPLSPQHSKILSHQLTQVKEKKNFNEEATFEGLSPDRYAKPICLDTPFPRNERQKVSQAESLASALGDKFGTDEIVAEELDMSDLNGLSRKAGRTLTLDEGEEISEDCMDITEESETFYDCSDGLSASHANLIKGIDKMKVRRQRKPTKSAPSTPTGTRKFQGILKFLHRTPMHNDDLNEAKSLPAIALNFREEENADQSTMKPVGECKSSLRPKQARASRVKRGSKTRR